MERNEADPSNQVDNEENVGLDRARLKEELGGHHQTRPEMINLRFNIVKKCGNIVQQTQFHR